MADVGNFGSERVKQLPGVVTMADTKAQDKDEEEVFVRSDREFFDTTLNFQGQNIERSGTPETMLTDYPLRPAPDISVLCDKCKCFISLTGLREHRIYHNSLTLLKYNNEEPKTADGLLKRRNVVLRKMKSAATRDKPVTPEQIQEVNNAYEYLKAMVEGKFEELRQIREDVDANVRGVALNGSSESVCAVGMASSQNERWKSYMEDARSFQDCFGEDKRKCFFGLYDGYHGRFAAEVAASELHKLLLSEMIKFDPRTKSVIGSNLAGDIDLSQYKFDRPNTKQSERVMLYDESVGIIQNIIRVCEAKYSELIQQLGTTGTSGGDTERSLDTERRKKRREKTAFEEKMEGAFCKAYYLLDILLSYGKDENSKLRWSGCSALTAVIQDLSEEERAEAAAASSSGQQEEEEKGSREENQGKDSHAQSAALDPPHTLATLHLANAGNTHAVLIRGNKAYGLTKDHTPNNKKERNRVLKDGGNLSDSSKECLVNGVILTTRGLGNHGDTKLKQCVLVEPYTTSVALDQYAQVLILATRGVWEVFSEKEAASLLIKLLPSNQIPPPRNINSSLHPLFEQLERDHSIIDSSSRRVSFSSVDTPSGLQIRTKSAERVKSGQRRSPTLHSVVENEEGQRGQRSQENRKDDDNKTDTGSERDDKTAARLSAHSQRSERSDQLSVREITHSTPTGSSNKDSGKSQKKTRRYIDADMQTEIGSQDGEYDEDDSGNEGDVDTYLENVSFPGSMSRISMIDGPPSREQRQRQLARSMAEHLVQAALLAGAKDNVSVTVVLLPGCGL